jgi:hypothetical protein
MAPCSNGAIEIPSGRRARSLARLVSCIRTVCAGHHRREHGSRRHIASPRRYAGQSAGLRNRRSHLHRGGHFAVDDEQRGSVAQSSLHDQRVTVGPVMAVASVESDPLVRMKVSLAIRFIEPISHLFRADRPFRQMRVQRACADI